jgi:malate dehydrogenase (oxaloacetate-decarboxylating)
MAYTPGVARICRAIAAEPQAARRRTVKGTSVASVTDGTAIVVLAALRNALRVVWKRMEDVTVALIGTGAAGLACARLLVAEGVGDLVAADRNGILGPDRDDLDPARRWFVDEANRARRSGATVDVLDGADVFLGVSGPDLFPASELGRMAAQPIVFALANPTPEVDPVEARRYAAVVATGRSDHPNQINNVLAFPGVFRGALDARARFITDEMKIAAARAIADVITDDELRPEYIIPSVFNPSVVESVAGAVRREAGRTGV